MAPQSVDIYWYANNPSRRKRETKFEPFLSIFRNLLLSTQTFNERTKEEEEASSEIIFLIFLSKVAARGRRTLLQLCPLSLPLSPFSLLLTHLSDICCAWRCLPSQSRSRTQLRSNFLKISKKKNNKNNFYRKSWISTVCVCRRMWKPRRTEIELEF